MLKSFKPCFVEVSDILDFRGYFLFLKLQTRQISKNVKVPSNMFTSADLR